MKKQPDCTIGCFRLAKCQKFAKMIRNMPFWAANEPRWVSNELEGVSNELERVSNELEKVSNELKGVSNELKRVSNELEMGQHAAARQKCPEMYFRQQTSRNCGC